MTTGLFGFGAHGGDICEQWSRCHPIDRLRVFDEDPAKDLAKRPLEGMRCLIGINDPWERRRAAERLRIAPAAPLVDPTAIVGEDCELGLGSVVAAGCLLLREVEIGVHSHVNYACCMTRTRLGDYVTVGPGVVFAGDIVVGDNVMIGGGSVISNLVTIGSDVTIGAGAVVLPRTVIPDGATAVGVPARCLVRSEPSVRGARL